MPSLLRYKVAVGGVLFLWALFECVQNEYSHRETKIWHVSKSLNILSDLI